MDACETHFDRRGRRRGLALVLAGLLPALSGCVKEVVRETRYSVSITEGRNSRVLSLSLDELEAAGLDEVKTDWPRRGGHRGVRLGVLADRLDAPRGVDFAVLSSQDGYKAYIPMAAARQVGVALVTRIGRKTPERFPAVGGEPLGLYSALPTAEFPAFGGEEFRFFWARRVSTVEFVRFEEYMAASMARTAERKVREGRDVFVANCMPCHTADGPGGFRGPDLVSTLGKRVPAEFVRFTLKHEAGGGRGERVPFEGRLSAEQLEGLYAYLGHLDAAAAARKAR